MVDRRQDAVLLSRADDDGRRVCGDDPSTWSKPKELFDGPYLLRSSGPTHYDAARDGRILMVKPVAPEGSGAPRQFIVVQNWFEELRRLAPPK